MKQAKKLNKVYTVNVDEETARMIEIIADYEQRKPRELLRLLLVPSLRAEFVKIQRQEHQENQAAPTVAKFTA